MCAYLNIALHKRSVPQSALTCLALEIGIHIPQTLQALEKSAANFIFSEGGVQLASEPKPNWVAKLVQHKVGAEVCKACLLDSRGDGVTRGEISIIQTLSVVNFIEIVKHKFIASCTGERASNIVGKGD